MNLSPYPQGRVQVCQERGALSRELTMRGTVYSEGVFRVYHKSDLVQEATQSRDKDKEELLGGGERKRQMQRSWGRRDCGMSQQHR